MRYEIAQANRLGNRASNQDRFTVVEKDEGILMVLADGMGGRPGGELAAQALLDYAEREYLSRRKFIENPSSFLAHIIHRAHAAINELTWSFDPPATPGTTGVLCLVERGQAHWAHVGDSRLYIFRRGTSIYRTTDHSHVEELFRQGIISDAERGTHPQRNQITQCIGCQPQTPQISLGKKPDLEAGDTILLCSDGFWNGVSDGKMAAMLKEGALGNVIETMAGHAESNAYPNSDNVSVLALRVLSLSAPRPSRDANAAQGKKSGTVQTSRTDPDRLKHAIDQLEQVMKEYEDELK